jgi:hypothetical protein
MSEQQERECFGSHVGVRIGIDLGDKRILATLSRTVQPDDTRLRQAALLALWDLQEAVDEDDLEAAQKCREKRLLLALELFSADRKRHGALEQVWDVSGRWVRHG